MKGIAWEWTLDTTRNAKESIENAGKKYTKGEMEKSTEARHIWRPVISRRKREGAKAFCDKATALFTDKFKS